MGKLTTKKVIDCKLIRVEKTFNKGKKDSYVYSLELEGIEDILLFSVDKTFDSNALVGKKLKYRIGDDNLISEFEII